MKAAILLIVEDAGIRDSLGHALRLEGYDLALASNGPEALNSLRATGFDLVLLDLDLPVCNGWDTLGQIITVSLSLPLIIITGRPEQQRPATPVGVAAALEKPLDLLVLLGVIERALGKTCAAGACAPNQNHESSP